MTKRPLPWSWLALALTVMPLGGVMMLGVYFTEGFRRGLDADMAIALYGLSTLERLAGMAELGAFGLLFIIGGWWFARGKADGERRFLAFVVGAPTLLLLTTKLIFYFDPTYLPNWLEPLAFAIAFLAGGLTYIRAARAATGFFRTAR